MSGADDQRLAPTETQRLRNQIDDLTRERDLYKRMLERYEPDPTYSTPTELDRLRARVAELEAAGSVSPRPPLRGGTPWQILAPEGPSARRDGYAVVTADWSEDADRAEYYVAEQMTREVAEMLVRAGSVSPDDAHTSTARHTEWLTFGTEDGDEGVETFKTEADAQRAADRWLRRGMTDVYVERHDVTTTRTVSTTTRTTDWKADEQ